MEDRLDKANFPKLTQEFGIPMAPEWLCERPGVRRGYLSGLFRSESGWCPMSLVSCADDVGVSSSITPFDGVLAGGILTALTLTLTSIRYTGICTMSMVATQEGTYALDFWGSPPHDIIEAMLCASDMPASYFLEDWLDNSMSDGLKNQQAFVSSVPMDHSREEVSIPFMRIDDIGGIMPRRMHKDDRATYSIPSKGAFAMLTGCGDTSVDALMVARADIEELTVPINIRGDAPAAYIT